MQNFRENLVDSFTDSAKEHGNRTALYVNGKSHTYDDLHLRALQISEKFEKASLVGLFCEKEFDTYATVLGILFSGSAYVPLSTRWPDTRIVQVLNLSQVKYIFCSEENQDRLKSLLPEVAHSIQVLSGNDFVESKEKSMPEISPQSRAYVMFTSGTTGQPKGIAITHEQVMAYIKNAMELIPIMPEDRVSQCPDLAFDLSVHDLFATWFSGAALYPLSNSQMLLPTSFVQEHDLTIWLSTPSTVSRCNQFGALKPDSLPSLRESSFCGEALTCENAEAWRKAAPNSNLNNLYGPTEATVAISCFSTEAGKPLLSAKNHLVPIGQIFPDHLHRIEEEELHLSGKQVISGYFSAGKTSSAFDWYKTGDRVKKEGDNLCYLGRVDDQVKIRGYRLELIEVNQILKKISGAAEVVTLPWPRPPQPCERLYSFVLSTQALEESVKSWITECRKVLPEYAIPWEIFPISEIKVNPNGKTDRDELYSELQARV